MTLKRALPFLLSLCVASALHGQDKSLHLAIGDPARKDREAPVVLDGITDTRTGEVITPAELPKRLAGAAPGAGGGEPHGHGLPPLRAAASSRSWRAPAGRCWWGWRCTPTPSSGTSTTGWTAGSPRRRFLKASRWYEAWGYNWLYYRDIFLFCRDHNLRMVAVNAPREVVTAVRKKGFQGLTPEEAAHIPTDVDTSSPEHRALFKSFFEAGGDSLHSGHERGAVGFDDRRAVHLGRHHGLQRRPGAPEAGREGHGDGRPRRLRPRGLRAGHPAPGRPPLRRRDRDRGAGQRPRRGGARGQERPGLLRRFRVGAAGGRPIRSTPRSASPPRPRKEGRR